jgi:transposase-like protein
MAGLLEFAARFGTEKRCIEHLAGLRWPGGFVCSGCGGRQAWRLKARPRVYECGACHRQESVTAGTVFHRTRTDLSKWFVAAYLMGRDKRGVSAKFLQRELAVAYQTAWTMAHKLRHGLSEDPARLLRGFGRLPHPPRRRMRHHHLRPTQGRHPAGWGQAHPAASRGSCTTCPNRIGRLT